MGVGGWGWTSLESAWLGLDVGGVTYLLQATFDADNQGYADAQVLDTEAEGVVDGQLTVVDTGAGTLAIVGNECHTDASASPGFDTTGAYSQAIAKVLGRTLLCEWSKSEVGSTSYTMPLQWTVVAGIAYSGQEAALYAYQDDIRYRAGAGAQVPVVVGDVVAGTTYNSALVLGGYDSNGVPWHSGAAGTYIHGGSLWVKGGVFTDWTLLWRDARNNTGTLYAAFQNPRSDQADFDEFRVPDADLSAVLEPLVKDTFTDDNGTSLDAHDPEVDAEGGGWTEQGGDSEIQGNRARAVGTTPGAQPYWLATVETAVADALLRATTHCTIAASVGGMALRWSSGANLWTGTIYPVGNLFRINEINAGAVTTRATIGVTINAATDYDVVLVADGQDIVAFLDGGSRIAYGSAALNETETEHGLYATWGNNTNVDLDNFHVHGRTGSQYDDVFDLY